MNHKRRSQTAIRRSSYSLLLVLLAFTITVASAQTETRQDDQSKDKPLARIETIEAKIPIRAFDPLGKRVLNLTPKDVVVIENGAGRQVASLKLEPANLLLVLDHSLEVGTHKNGRATSSESSASASGPNRWLNAPASVEFAENLISLLGENDRIAIIQYSDKTELIQAWTANRGQARSALRARFRQGHKTRFYDALLLAAETFKTAPAGRPILVLLTDGVDTASQTQKEPAMGALARAGATIYAVSLSELIRGEISATKPKVMSGHGGTPKDTASAGVSIDISPWSFKRRNELKEYARKSVAGAAELKQLAENSGGESYLPKSFDEMIGNPDEILKEIGAQYTLTYLTERRPSETAPRDLEVRGARSGLSVRARTKYFAGKPETN
jgi:VWFA-related protein